MIPIFPFFRFDDDDDDDLDELLEKKKEEEEVSEKKKRQLIFDKLVEDVAEGKVTCDVCKSHIDRNSNYSSWSLVSENRAYVMCEDCEKRYNFEVCVSNFTLPLFFNLSSFTSNTEKKLIEKNIELEKRIEDLERKIKVLQNIGEEVF